LKRTLQSAKELQRTGNALTIAVQMGEKKLLIFHQGALGDFVLTFPALIRLKKHFTPIDAVCKSQLGELAKELGMIDNWFSQDAARFASLFSDSTDPDVKNLLNTYDEIILFSFSEDLAQSINQVWHHAVYRISPRPKPTDNIHVAVHLLKNLAGCGLIAEDSDLNTTDQSSFYLQPEVFCSTPHSRRVLLHPGAGSKKKMWPIKNFLQVEGFLKSDRYKPEYIIGPADRFLRDKIQMPGARQKVVHTPENITALMALMKTAGGYIGNDSGVSHLAAYLGLPTVAVFGPSDPSMWRPVGPAVCILSPQILECDYKIETRSHFANKTKGFNNITPEMVLKALYNVKALI
jgi:ADP-heptose:LPS heptosyltransferase